MLIPLQCPHCNESHNIADSFAGGVYRCTKCNTLMSVPKAASQAAPVSSAATRAGERTVPITSRKFEPAVPKSAAKLPAAPKAASALAPYKWPLVTGAAVLAVLLGAIGLAIHLAQTPDTTPLATALTPVADAPQVQPTPEPKAPPPVADKTDPPTTRPASVPPPTPSAAATQAFDYAPGVLTNDKPNVLGLPILGNAMVIIDGATSLNHARPDLHRLLIDGLGKNIPGQYSLALRYAITDPMIAANVKAGIAVPRTGMEGYLKKIKPNAHHNGLMGATFKLIVQYAQQEPAGHLFLVFGHPLGDPKTQTTLHNLFNDPAHPIACRVDIILIDADAATQKSVELADIVRAHQGHVLYLTGDALKQAVAGLK